MIYFISIYQGQKHGRNKYIECYLGYSRDGKQYYRTTNNRQPFISEDKKSKRNFKKESYVIMAGGNLLIVDEKIFFYVFNYNQNLKEVNTYLYFLRRDGFSSVSTINNDEISILTTKFLQKKKEQKYLFINYKLNNENDYLQIEVIDENGSIINKSDLIKVDSIKHKITWEKELIILDKFRLKFYFKGNLYSFWFSKNITGESDGFIGNGGQNYEYYSDSIINKDKLNIIRYSNIEITLEINSKISKYIQCINEYFTNIVSYELITNNTVTNILIKYLSINKIEKNIVVNCELNNYHNINIISVKKIL
jgi:hypothetical protein